MTVGGAGLTRKAIEHSGTGQAVMRDAQFARRLQLMMMMQRASGRKRDVKVGKHLSVHLP